MSKIPNRHELGEYNIGNLMGYDRGYVDCYEGLIEGDIDSMADAILDEMTGHKDKEDYNTFDTITQEVVTEFVKGLKDWLNIRADEYSCSAIESYEEDR